MLILMITSFLTISKILRARVAIVWINEPAANSGRRSSSNRAVTCQLPQKPSALPIEMHKRKSHSHATSKFERQTRWVKMSHVKISASVGFLVSSSICWHYAVSTYMHTIHFGQFRSPVSMTWGQIFKLPFRGHKICISTRFAERNTMVFLVFSPISAR